MKERRLETRSERDRLLDMHRSLEGISVFDPERFYFGFDPGAADWRRQQRLHEFLQKIVPEIIKASHEHGVSHFVFVQDEAGQGMSFLAGLLMHRCKNTTSFLRPQQRLFAAKLKGRRIICEERVMLLFGDAQDGEAISGYASELRRLGANVPAAFVLVGNESAKERLALDGVELVSYWTREAFERLRQVA